MSGNCPTSRDGHHQSDEEFGVSQFGDDDDNLVSWATHPAAVDALFERQQSDYFDTLSSASDHVLSGEGFFSDWTSVEPSTNVFANFPGSSTYPLQHFVGPPLPTPGLAQPTSFTNATEPPTPAPAPLVCEEKDQETLLIRLRAAGYGYAAISEKMREQLGIEITANALVKRYQKSPKTCESVSRPLFPPELGHSGPVDGTVLT
jgi:hypothetical protein